MSFSATYSGGESLLEIPSEIFSQGVILCTLQEAQQKHASILVENNVSEKVKDAGEHGLFLYLPEGVTVSEPLTINSCDDVTDHLHKKEHLVIIAENGSSCTIFQKGREPQLTFRIKKHAAITLTQLLTPPILIHNNKVEEIIKEKKCENPVTIEANGFLRHSIFAVEEIKSNTNIRLSGRNAQVVARIASLAGKNSKPTIKYMVTHEESHTISDVRTRAVLRESAVGTYHCISRILIDAHESNTYLAAHALITSPDASAHPYPAFEIEANDIRARHASSVSRVQGEHLFYLMSRGLTEEESRKNLVFAFLNEVLIDFPETVQEVALTQWQH